MLFILLSVLALAAGNPIGGPALLVPASVSASRVNIIHPSLRTVAVSSPVLSTGLIGPSAGLGYGLRGLGWGGKGLGSVALAAPVSAGVLSSGLALGGGWVGKGIGPYGGGWAGPALAHVAVASPAISSGGTSVIGAGAPLSLGGWSGRGVWGGKWN